MNVRVAFALFALFALAFAQTRENKLTIDPFTPNTPTLVLLIADELPFTMEVSTADAGILGGERDLSLTAESGSSNLVLTTGVSSGLWSVSTPNSARGFALMQYDGIDGSIALNTNGLGGVNLMADSADGFVLFIQSDIDTVYQVTVYSGNASSELQITIPGDDETNEYTLAFADFNGNADFSNVGAIEILIEAFDNVDTFVQIFGTTGEVVVDPSPSPSPSTIPPPPPGGFTWYTFDDDDNGRSPCGDEEPRRTYFISDDNIVYYYFYGVDQPIIVESSSDASALMTSVGLVAGLVAFFM